MLSERAHDQENPHSRDTVGVLLPELLRLCLAFAAEAVLPCAEDAPAQAEAVLFQPFDHLRTEAGRFQLAPADRRRNVRVGLTGRLVHENVLQDHLVAFETLNFRDLGDLA